MCRAWIRRLLVPIVAFVVMLLSGLACSKPESTDGQGWTG